VIIRKANKKDIDAIMEIEKRSFDWYEIFPKNLFDKYLTEYKDGFYVALNQSDSIIGYAILAEKNGNGYLVSIAVHPKNRNKGVAVLLMNFLESQCKEKRFNKLTLEVRVDNKPAIAAYKKLGLKEVGIKIGFYGDGTNALMMEKKIKDVKPNFQK
jgi:[ribosomal protein S18]-alanine N-acetyltransferase